MRAAALLVIVVACGHTPTRSEHWFAERGRQNPTWHTCLRMGAELRYACGTNAACATEVTRDMTRACYAGRYEEETSHSTPNDAVHAERLSPCFWDNEPNKPASAALYAQQTCSIVVDAKLQPACVAELRDVIEVVCAAGAPDLTGAGP